MTYLFTALLCTWAAILVAQTNLKIQNGTTIKVNSNVDIVLKNTSFENNGTFNATNGKVHLTGNSSTNQSRIGGTNPTTFHKLVVNKAVNDIELGNNITINTQLIFQSGKVVIGNHNLTMGNPASFSGQNKDRYIKTNGTGTLIRQVENIWTAFPVGNSTFNPARLKNSGTVDNFSVRVVDNFLQNGTSGNAVTTNVIPRTWMIDEATAGGSDVSMRLIWRPLHHNGNGFNDNNATITHFTGGDWQDLGSGVSVADNSYSSDHRYREASNITSFSPFGARTVSNLPVELLYFYAEKEGDNVRLDWQTATELNNSHFDVEWSTDGISFEKIGEMAGAGTTNEVQFYDFLHENPTRRDVAVQRLYYRLKQVDFDGAYEYTNIIQITIQLPIAIGTNNSTINVFPNPASHYLKIESENLVGEMVQIFNVNGRLVKEFQHQPAYQGTTGRSLITNLPITNLRSGTYFLKIDNQVQKIIIQND